MSPLAGRPPQSDGAPVVRLAAPTGEHESVFTVSAHAAAECVSGPPRGGLLAIGGHETARRGCVRTLGLLSGAPYSTV